MLAGDVEDRIDVDGSVGHWNCSTARMQIDVGCRGRGVDAEAFARCEWHARLLSEAERCCGESGGV